MVFDPCTYVPDEAVTAAGFDPATRERDDYLAEQTMLVCVFTVPSGKSSLFVTSTNYPYEGRLRYYIDFGDMVDANIAVNERRAAVVRGVGGDDACDALVETRIGTVFVAVLDDQADPCGRIIDIAHVIEPWIGEDN